MDAVEFFPIEVRPLDDLRPDPNNPQTHADGDIQRLHHSISTHGMLTAPVWNRRTGYLVGGHARVEVLRQMGVTSCPVLVVDKDDDAEAAANIALNASYGHSDPALTAAIIRQLEAAQVDIDDLCLPSFEIDRIIAEAERAVDEMTAQPEGAASAVASVEDGSSPTCEACGRALPKRKRSRP